MTNKEIARCLKDLVGLVLEATREYSWALEEIRDEGIREQLSDFKDDHQEHLENLSVYLEQLGEKIPVIKDTNKTLTHETQGGRQFEPDDILRTLMQNEKIISRKYEEAMEQITVAGIVADLENDFEDDQMHIQIIEGILSEIY